ncbi:hypothetical protein [Leeia sp.]|uniref:hypothetical protein n=1 Tax=Leeia sp. TaxID=2884678 RepID=UPI0035B24F64
MTYILAEQRDQDDLKAAAQCWAAYQAFLQDNQQHFPPGAYALATSDWFYNFRDPRCPHDAWLEWARFEEPSEGERSEIRTTSLRVRLLGAYHDLWLELYYPRVYAYTCEVTPADHGHGDWRYDEFRLSERGHLLHEIEWADGGRWLIEASDLQFSWLPRERTSVT